MKKLAWFLVIMLILSPAVVLAGELSGSQTVTVEFDADWERITIWTSVVNYAVTDWWHITAVADVYPEWSTDVDLSTTLYVPIRDFLYTTVGVRRGVYNSDRPWTPYIQATIQF